MFAPSACFDPSIVSPSPSLRAVLALEIVEVLDVPVKLPFNYDDVKIPKPRGRPKKVAVARSKKQGHHVSCSIF